MHYVIFLWECPNDLLTPFGALLLCIVSLIHQSIGDGHKRPLPGCCSRLGIQSQTPNSERSLLTLEGSISTSQIHTAALNVAFYDPEFPWIHAAWSAGDYLDLIRGFMFPDKIPAWRKRVSQTVTWLLLRRELLPQASKREISIDKLSQVVSNCNLLPQIADLGMNMSCLSIPGNIHPAWHGLSWQLKSWEKPGYWINC